MNKVKQRAVTSLLAPVVLAGGIVTLGTGAAHASDRIPAQAVGASKASPRVDPIEEQRSKCVHYHDKNACKSLMINTKMMKAVKNCLIKGAVAGAGTLVIGRYVSKDLAEKVAKSTVVSGATGCLASLT